jgi:hypothetical protein
MYINTYTSYMHYMHTYIYIHYICTNIIYVHTYIYRNRIHILILSPFDLPMLRFLAILFLWCPSAPRHAWRNLSFIGFLGQHPSIGSDSGGGDEDNEDFGSWWVKSTDMSCKCHVNVMYSENTQIHEMLNKRCGNMCLYWDYSMAM